MGFAGRSWWISGQPAPLSPMLSATLHNTDPSFQRWREDKPRTLYGGNIPTGSGGGRQAPSTQPPVLADVRGHPCPDPSKAQEPRGCTGHKSPVAWGAVGLGPAQWPPRPCPCETATFSGPSGHGRGSLCWGAGAVLPRRTLGGKDKRIFSAENSPSVSFPCPAPPGASGAAARPPAEGISYPLNPCGAGAERQESQFIPRES